MPPDAPGLSLKTSPMIRQTPLLLLSRTEGYPDVLAPYGIPPRSVLLIRAILKVGAGEGYVSQGSVKKIYDRKAYTNALSSGGLITMLKALDRTRVAAFALGISTASHTALIYATLPPWGFPLATEGPRLRD